MSTWEIGVKVGLGKIDADLDEVIAAVGQTGFVELPVKMSHTARVRDIPAHHRDPFDRMLIAQALDEHLTVVTRDRAFNLYDVPTLWR